MQSCPTLMNKTTIGLYKYSSTFSDFIDFIDYKGHIGTFSCSGSWRRSKKDARKSNFYSFCNKIVTFSQLPGSSRRRAKICGYAYWKRSGRPERAKRGAVMWLYSPHRKPRYGPPEAPQQNGIEKRPRFGGRFCVSGAAAASLGRVSDPGG